MIETKDLDTIIDAVLEETDIDLVNEIPFIEEDKRTELREWLEKFIKLVV